MNDKYFVDTNIFVYAHDRAAGAKHKRAAALLEELWDSESGVLSTQVLQELCVILRNKTSHPLSAEELRGLIYDYMSWEIVANTPESILSALEIEVRHRISFWDALIVHAAEYSGAAVLYSEDLSHGHKYGSVRVLNPFLDSAT
jgi:predicted nucleic acid-binding protein